MLDTVGRCANLACPNRSNQGRFDVVITHTDVVGGHRPLVLFLCAPCAEALVKEVQG